MNWIWAFVARRDFRIMDVAAQQHDSLCAGLRDHIKQALALKREIAPFLHRFFIGDDLRARRDQPYISGLTELIHQPGPLQISKQHGLGIRVRQILAANVERGLFLFWPLVLDVTALEGAAVEQDDLEALALGPEYLRVIDLPRLYRLGHPEWG